MRDVVDWFDGASRVLFVHAHPDDETISTGGTLAGLAATGRSPLLVTLTRGERGEVVPGPFSALQGTPGLAAHRETELAAALFMLGVQDHAFLGNPPARAAGLDAKVYEDSGMEWGSDGWATAAADAPDTALTRAPAVEALNDLLALADEWGAEAIVSYGARGGYGHPDHVFAHRAARAVAHGLELPFWEIVAGADAGAGAGARPAAEVVPGPGSDADGTDAADADAADTTAPDTAAPVNDGVDGLESHDVAPWLDRKVAALRSHATQFTVEAASDRAGSAESLGEIVHVGGQRQPIDRVESFRRVGSGAAVG